MGKNQKGTLVKDVRAAQSHKRPRTSIEDAPEAARGKVKPSKETKRGSRQFLPKNVWWQQEIQRIGFLVIFLNF
jgi:hypothetical protein